MTRFSHTITMTILVILICIVIGSAIWFSFQTVGSIYVAQPENTKDSGSGILSMLLSLRLVLILVLLVLFQGVGEHEIRALGTRLVEAVADLKLQSGSEAITPSISLGATFFSAIDTKYADALNRADRALYQAKELGKNRACFADCDAS